MRIIGLILVSAGMAGVLNGGELGERAWGLEKKREGQAARGRLERAARGTSDAEAWHAYAEFLDRHRDPDTRAAYEKALSFMSAGGAPEKAAVTKRLAALDLLAGDRDAAARHLKEYSDASG